jgi:multidrug efflux pump subunit AcrA (membrane-fusion protein)
MFISATVCLSILFSMILITPSAAQTAPTASENVQDQSTAPAAPVEAPPAEPEDESESVDLVSLLLKQIEIMRDEMNAMRVQLAQAQLELASAQRERDELRQFISDHDQYRSDFAQYEGVKAMAEREAKKKELEEARRQREAERAEREARQKAARAEKMQRHALEARAQHYRDAGFTPVGLDVYTGKMAFFYQTKDLNATQVEWNIDIGTYLSPIQPMTEIDYSKMTISGSVINGADDVRNIGVALTFFDNYGNQVGHEIVQIKNARPDVPYPFTSKIDMALNRAFTSSSIYVLYADPVEAE